MATTGLYSQHLHNRKVLYLRNTIIAIILIVLAAATLFPICYMFLSAFGPNVATAGNMRTILPSRLTLESFNAFFHFSDHSLRWILNSLVVATGVVIGNVIFASMAGYAFAKLEFPCKKLLFGLVLWSLRSIGRTGYTKGDRTRVLAVSMFAGMCGVLVHCYFENIFEVPYMMAYFWSMAAAVMYLGYFRKRKI